MRSFQSTNPNGTYVELSVTGVIVPQEAKNSITTNHAVIVMASITRVISGTNKILRLDLKKSPAAFIIAIATLILLQKQITTSKNTTKILNEAIPNPLMTSRD